MTFSYIEAIPNIQPPAWYRSMCHLVQGNTKRKNNFHYFQRIYVSGLNGVFHYIFLWLVIDIRQPQQRSSCDTACCKLPLAAKQPQGFHWFNDIVSSWQVVFMHFVILEACLTLPHWPNSTTVTDRPMKIFCYIKSFCGTKKKRLGGIVIWYLDLSRRSFRHRCNFLKDWFGHVPTNFCLVWTCPH